MTPIKSTDKILQDKPHNNWIITPITVNNCTCNCESQNICLLWFLLLSSFFPFHGNKKFVFLQNKNIGLWIWIDFFFLLFVLKGHNDYESKYEIVIVSGMGNLIIKQKEKKRPPCITKDKTNMFPTFMLWRILIFGISVGENIMRTFVFLTL